ncbi:MAG: hypothetical protein QGI75_09285, partial [Phycisphaerales bacterium]|nr:hypothetical protein [Phycisphaerales bacterium]
MAKEKRMWGGGGGGGGGGGPGSSSTLALGRRVDHELGQIASGELPADPRRELHAFTLEALLVLEEAGLRPVAAQVPVWCGGVGSAVDLVALDRDGAAVVLEVKTGAE